MNIRQAIITVRKLKDKPLNVKYFGNYAFYDPDNDEGWIEYRNARNYIFNKSKSLEKILRKLNII